MSMKRALIGSIVGIVCLTAIAFAARGRIQLPTQWYIDAPSGPEATIGVMPQGIALSPDGTRLAVIESGVNPPALRILSPSDLTTRKIISIKGAFGKPVWLDERHVLIAGANADAILDVNVDGTVSTALAERKGSWPAAVALSPDRKMLASANDESATVTVASVSAPNNARTVSVGSHPSDLVFSNDGRTLYVASRGASKIYVLDIAAGKVTDEIPVGSHPSALALSANGTELYVAESDDDSVAAINLKDAKRVADVNVGLHAGRASGYGASPNALLVRRNIIFVSLGAENAVAVVKGGSVIERIPTGWYPTGIAVGPENALFVSDGKGEGSFPNPEYSPFAQDPKGYIAATQFGSVRKIPFGVYAGARAVAQTASVIANAMPTWTAPPASSTVIRPNGPIKHIIYIIKENRSYDEILGDEKLGDGDPSLVWFGRVNTPNQHALVERFGVLDRAFVDSQVSADGHNWTDAAFSGDYVERFWPENYGNRRVTYDFQSGKSPERPHNGYLWNAAKRAGVAFRDYGEDTGETSNMSEDVGFEQGFFKGLIGHTAPGYRSWDLRYSDMLRYQAWKSEFRRFVANGNLPALEIVYFPNDHTAGSDPGSLTPQAMVAQNDWAVGSLVDAVSHSKYWKSTAIFALEDDAQSGPDHINAQRSPFYVASPYAKPGAHHEHYTTAGVLHTIEIILGMHPLSIYDQTALPLYAEFDMHANMRPFVAIRPTINMEARNTKAAYGAKKSAALNLSEPDAASAAVLNDIIAHAVHNVSSLRAEGR